MLESNLHYFNMFSRKYLLCIFTLFVLLHPSYGGHKCESNKKKFLVSIINSDTITCPPIFGDDDDKFCCTRPDGYTMYCCDASDFIEQSGIGFIMPVLVSITVALMVVCCVCCLCCPCCLWYKRRNRGTVYNNVPPVSVAMNSQPAVPPHGPHSDVYQQQPPPYPVMPMSMPQPQMQGGMYPPVPPHGVSSQQQYPPSQYPPSQYPQAQPQAQFSQSQYPPAQYPPAVPPHAQQPPPYNEVGNNQMYAKQSPYNPNF